MSFSASAPLANRGPHQLGHEERVAAARVGDGVAERRGDLVERALDEPSDGVPAQRREPEPMELLIGEQPGEELAFRAGLGRPSSDHGSDRQAPRHGSAR